MQPLIEVINDFKRSLGNLSLDDNMTFERCFAILEAKADPDGSSSAKVSAKSKFPSADFLTHHSHCVNCRVCSGELCRRRGRAGSGALDVCSFTHCSIWHLTNANLTLLCTQMSCAGDGGLLTGTATADATVGATRDAFQVAASSRGADASVH